MSSSSIEGAGGLHVVVTGASSGIGEATGRLLASLGHRVVLAARRGDLVEAVAREVNPSGKRVIAVQADVSEPADRERLLARAHGIFGPVDVLVNNAGIGGPSGRWWQNGPDEARRVLEVNLLAAVELTRLVLPEMIERRTGHIVSVGSVAGRTAGGASLYSASKFGLRGFSLGLRRELLGSGVSASLVAPGFIRTSMTEWQTRLPMPGPEAVARVIAALLERPRAEVVVPGWYRPLIWLESVAPAFGDAVVKRF